MTARKPLRVSGMIKAGEVQETTVPGRDFGAGVPTAQQPTSVPLADIADSPYQPRLHYDSAEIDHLAHMLASAGQQEPIIVRRREMQYELIAGHRRVRAARSIGWTHIRATVTEIDDAEAEKLTMVSNESRVDLNDYERARLYKRAMELGLGRTQTEIAHFFGTNQGKVSKCLAMLDLPTPYQAMLEQKPDAFGAACASEIRNLLAEYPSEADLVLQGVERVFSGEAAQLGLVGWVQQMVKQKSATKTDRNWIVVTNTAGRAMFTAKSASRAITVRINTRTFDEATVQRAVIKALKELADQGSVEPEE